MKGINAFQPSSCVKSFELVNFSVFSSLRNIVRGHLIYFLLHEFNKDGYIFLTILLDRGIFTWIKHCLTTISCDLAESDFYLHKKYT